MLIFQIYALTTSVADEKNNTLYLKLTGTINQNMNESHYFLLKMGGFNN